MSEILICSFDFKEDLEPIPDFDIFSEGVIYPTGKIKITVDGEGITDNGFRYMPYFKIYNGNSFSSSGVNNRNRIYLFAPAYINHTTNPGKWKLNKNQLKQLYDILISAPQNEIKSLSCGRRSFQLK